MDSKSCLRIELATIPPLKTSSSYGIFCEWNEIVCDICAVSKDRSNETLSGWNGPIFHDTALAYTHPNSYVFGDTMYQLHESTGGVASSKIVIHLYESTKKHLREEALLHPSNHIHLYITGLFLGKTYRKNWNKNGGLPPWRGEFINEARLLQVTRFFHWFF